MLVCIALIISIFKLVGPRRPTMKLFGMMMLCLVSWVLHIVFAGPTRIGKGASIDSGVPIHSGVSIDSSASIDSGVTPAAVRHCEQDRNPDDDRDHDEGSKRWIADE
ncbi:unnamed protein product, partial [Polarella glacialis]